MSRSHAAVFRTGTRTRCSRTPRLIPEADDASAEDALEIQVHEDGGIRLFFSHFSHPFKAHELRPVAENLIYDGAAVECTRWFLALVREAAERGGYFGNSALALGATRLKGMRAHEIDRDDHFSPKPPSRSMTTRKHRATYSELTAAPGTLTRRLVGPLLRALATEDRYAQALAD